MVRRTVQGRQFICHDNDIIPLLSYLDDKAIASYHGISVERVAAVRAKNPPTATPRRTFIPAVQNEPAIGGDNRTTETLAQKASATLLERLNNYFAKWEAENGFKAGAGMLLLPAGWQDHRRAG